MSAKFLLRLRADSSGIKDLAGNTITNSGTSYANAGVFTGGRAITFDGVSSTITSSLSDVVNANEDFTFAWWNKTTKLQDALLGQQANTIIWRNITVAASGETVNERFSIFDGTALNIDHIVYDTFFTDNWTPTPVTDGAWHHFAVVRNSNTIKFFVDGVLAHTSSVAVSAGFFNISNPLYLGCSPGRTAYDGSIDDLCIIKGLALWTADFTPPTDYLSLRKFLFIDENRAVWGNA